MVLSGIRPSFPSLSRSTGQITHVLLTRSPLEHPHQKSGGLSVRLACVKHAASVRPEPGSNSPKKQTKNYRQKTKKPTKQQQTTNTINNYWCSCSRSCSCSYTNNKSLLHQMTHYRVLKQHHHPQPNTTKSTGPQTATTQIYKPHPKTTNPHVTTTKTGKNYTKFASLRSWCN